MRIVANDERLALHVQAVENAMNLAESLHNKLLTDDEDASVIRMLGMRTFNAFGASLKLALSGYSQNSVLIMRDILETVFLLDYFSGDPALVRCWRVADDKARRRVFSPAAVRKALDERDGFEGRKREEIYRIFSELAAHPTPKSDRLMRPRMSDDAVIGPFISQTSLDEVLSEIGRLAVQVGEILDGFFPETGEADAHVRKVYAQARKRWLATFYSSA